MRTVVVERREACLTVAPPVLQPWTVEGPEAACPTRWAVCLTASSAAALTVNTERTVDWIRDAWARCAPAHVDTEATSP